MTWNDVSEAVMVKTGQKVELSGSAVFIWIGNGSESFLARLWSMDDVRLGRLINELDSVGFWICGAIKKEWSDLAEKGFSEFRMSTRGLEGWWGVDTPIGHIERVESIAKRLGSRFLVSNIRKGDGA